MIENAMVIGEYDTRPEMTSADEQQRILEIEEELCNERRDWLIDELVNNGDFAREVANVLLSASRDKLYDINGIFDREVRSYARWLADIE